MPILLYPGTSPIKKVEPPISTSVNKKVDFLPIKSPSLPKTNAPNGRTMKPAAKIANVLSKAAVGSPFGKNCVEMVVESIPKM